MKQAFELAELASSRTLSSLFQLPKRNLGCAILVAAIEDYQSLDEQTHGSAALFLFPSSRKYREHYDWVTSMATGVNPAWLRDALDSTRKEWDRTRLEKKLRAKFESQVREAHESQARELKAACQGNSEYVHERSLSA